MTVAALLDEQGVTTVEYAILLSVMLMAALGIWSAFGAHVKSSVAIGATKYAEAVSAH